MENIRDAIKDYLEVFGEPEVRCEIREMEVAAGLEHAEASRH